MRIKIKFSESSFQRILMQYTRQIIPTTLSDSLSLSLSNDLLNEYGVPQHRTVNLMMTQPKPSNSSNVMHEFVTVYHLCLTFIVAVIDRIESN